MRCKVCDTISVRRSLWVVYGVRFWLYDAEGYLDSTTALPGGTTFTVCPGEDLRINLDSIPTIPPAPFFGIPGTIGSKDLAFKEWLNYNPAVDECLNPPKCTDIIFKNIRNTRKVAAYFTPMAPDVCPTTNLFTIQPVEFEIDNITISSTDPSVYEIIVNVTGGTPNFISTINGGSKTHPTDPDRTIDFSVSSPGTYSISITDANGCTLDTVVVVSGTRLENNLKKIQDKFYLYPNPTRNAVSIKYKLVSSDQLKVELYNLLGLKIGVYELAPNKDELTINTSDWASGVYLCRFVRNNNEVVTTEKLVIIRE